MNGTQAAKRISEMPSSQVPEWVKGMALSFENRALAEKALVAFSEKVEQKVSGGGTPNDQNQGRR